MKEILVPEEELVNTELLTIDGKNPNKMQEKHFVSLKKNIERYGFLIPIITNNDLLVADGEHRLKAAKELGMKEVKVIRLPIKDVDRRILRQVMNKLRGEHDETLDLEEFEEIMKEDSAALQELLGWSDKETARINDLLLSPLEEKEFDVDAHIRHVKTTIKHGDLFVLGNHRLLCGDATKETDVEKLMNGEQADMLFTDPPYGVSYGSKNAFLNTIDKGNRIQDDIIDDDLVPEDIYLLWKNFLTNSAGVCSETASYYVCSPQGGELMMMMMKAIHESPWSLKHTITWVKNNHVLGRCDYNYKHEPILYGWKKKGTHKFIGGGSMKTSVWEVDKPHQSKLHPTMKPIELMTNAIQNSTQQEETILDLFGGSGSTLIACEQTNRRCRMLEIDPVYCQVIIDRWEALTGKKAMKGETI